MLHYLVELMGPEKVMLGSDYPFPLGEVASVAPLTGEVLDAYPGQLIEGSSLSDRDKATLLAGTALEWLSVEPSRFAARLACDAPPPPPKPVVPGGGVAATAIPAAGSGSACSAEPPPAPFALSVGAGGALPPSPPSRLE